MKRVFYGIIALIVLYFVLAFFGPKSVTAERHITINASTNLVREKLGDLQYFHEKWSPWTEKDPQMRTTVTGIPGQPGHQYEWSGNENVGSGSITLERYSGDSLVEHVALEGQGDALSYLIVKEQGPNSDVTWGMTFHVGFMMRTPMLFMKMDDMLGKDYEKGLVRLKETIESEERENRSAAL
jgi:hypothetical protein